MIQKSILALLTGACLSMPATADEEASGRTPEIAVQQDGNGRQYWISDAGGWNSVMAAIIGLRKDPSIGISEIEQWTASGVPPYRIELARRLCKSDPKRALREFYRANIQIRYDIKRCTDPTAAAGLQATLITLSLSDCADSMNLSRKEILHAITDIVDDQKFGPPDTSPWWICSHGMAVVRAGLEGRKITEPDWLVPAEKWPEIWQSLLMEVRQSLSD